MLSINIKKIKDIHHKKEKISEIAQIDAAAYGYESFRLIAPLEFEGEMTNLGDYIDISGEARVKIELICDSCGEPFSFDITVPFSEYYSYIEESPDQNGEKDIHLFSGEGIDISPEVLSSIFLELPMKALCREDCRGLCQNCGKNLNLGPCDCDFDDIDPRLAKLKELNDGQKKGV